MTSIGFHARSGPRSVVLPRPTPRSAPQPTPAAPAPVSLLNPDARMVVPPAGGWIRVGKVSLLSAVRYLVVWATVFFAVLVLVLTAGYAALAVLGVTGSLSKALAIIAGEPLPSSGVVTALQAQVVLPAIVLGSAVLAVLSLGFVLAGVLVHNATTSLTGGIRVRIRPEPVRRRRAAAPTEEVRDLAS